MDLLFENFELLADAPNGVQKLRELILQLAVQGKLVPQDSKDEPASELLKRIQTEKEKLIVDGEIKKEKPLPQIRADEKPYNLPDGWDWCRLNDIMCVINGRAYKQAELLDKGIPVLRVGNLFTSKHWYYSNLELDDDKYCNRGDLIYAWSASFGPFIWNGERCIYHYHIWKLDLFLDYIHLKNYTLNYLQNETQRIKASGHGISMAHMTKVKMEKLFFPLPPLEEQKRIVAKVDQLMTLCDDLEKQKERRSKKRVSIHNAAIHHLLESKEQSEFNTNWKRIQENFDLLYEAPENVAQLKQAILQLAVQGKLVPQNPSDEPASELLEKIKIEKEKLIAEGKLKATKPLPPIGEDEKPYELPQGWEWTRLQEIGKINPRNYIEDELDVSFSPMTLVPFEFEKSLLFEIRKWRELKSGFTHFKENDVLVAKITPSFENGKSVVARNLKNGYGAGTTELHIFRGNQYLILPEYVFIYFKSPKFLEVGALNMTGTAGQQRVPRTYVAENPFPLPPFKEQKRIVAKVDALMQLCDGLEGKLSKSKQRASGLMNAVVQGVFNDAL